MFVKEVKHKAEKLQESFEEVLNNIEKQRKMWLQEIDKIVNALKEDVCGMKKMQMKAQNDHLSRLRELLLDVKKAVQRNKDFLESLEISKSLSNKSMNSTLMRFPPKLEISFPRFLPKVIENELNSEKIGVITGSVLPIKKGVTNLNHRLAQYLKTIKTLNEIYPKRFWVIRRSFPHSKQALKD